MGGVTDDVLLARAYLSRVAEPGCVPLWAAVLEHGPVAVADAVRRGDVSEELHAATVARAAVTEPGADLEAASRCGARLLVPEGDGWPHVAMSCLERSGLARLRRWQQSRQERKQARSGELVPPLALWVRGPLDLAPLSLRSVALVGSRSATQYGTYIAKEWAYRLAMREFDIVSGGAVGIDAAAHRGALAADGRTVLVSARGVDEPYPPTNRGLFDRVIEAGAVVSECPPGAVPQRQRFLSRNRLIAAFSSGTVVVEAAARSGALNTATHCRGLDRTLMAVPGPVTSAQSTGVHGLMQHETAPAQLVCRPDDVIGLIGGASDVSSRPASTEQSVTDRLDAVAQRVLDGFPATRPVLAEDVAIASGVRLTDVLGTLPMLEALQLVRRDETGRVRLVRADTTPER